MRNSSRITLLLGAALCGWLLVQPAAEAQVPSFATGNPGRKLGRGLANLFGGIFELPVTISRVGHAEGPWAAITVGMVYGGGAAVMRTLVGAAEVLTFPFPLPGIGYAPIIHPEFLTDPDLPPDTPTTFGLKPPAWDPAADRAAAMTQAVQAVQQPQAEAADSAHLDQSGYPGQQMTPQHAPSLLVSPEPSPTPPVMIYTPPQGARQPGPSAEAPYPVYKNPVMRDPCATDPWEGAICRAQMLACAQDIAETADPCLTARGWVKAK